MCAVCLLSGTLLGNVVKMLFAYIFCYYLMNIAVSFIHVPSKSNDFTDVLCEDVQKHCL